MQFQRTPIAITAIILCTGALPAAAQTTTIEAESMALSAYAVENGNRIRLTSGNPGTATKSFSGTSGTYRMQVHVVPETDGQSTLEVYRGSSLLKTYTYPLSSTATSFTIDNVTLNSGESIRLVGRPNGGAVARVDKVVLTALSTSTPTPTTPTPTPPTTSTPEPTTPTTSATTTMEAESMALSAYIVESGTRIRLASGATAGTATKGFSGAAGTYRMQVHVVPESDGQSTLEVYRGSTLLRNYTYPLSDTATSFTIDNVTLNSGDSIRLVGRPNGGAVARVDKVVLTALSTSTPTTPTTGTPTTPTTGTPTTPTTGTPPIVGDAAGSVSPVTMEAESMALSAYAVENGNRIRLTTSNAGTATKSFPGASGTYNVTVYVVPETDGQSTLELYKGSAFVHRYTYPLTANATSYTVSNVSLQKGDSIRLVGRPNGGAVARVDKLAFTPVNGSPTQPTPSSPPQSLPSTNTKAIATFHSLGLYWKPPSNPGAAGCNVQYRKSGETTWKNGLAMWYDSRNAECRGSIVHLTPGSEYQVQFSVPGQQPSAALTAKTWSETFPIAKTVRLPAGTSSETLNITEGGTASGYVLYTAAEGGSTIDVANARANNITISAPYVIVRGLVLKGARNDAIRLLQGAHDVVIEGNDISGWGSYSGTTTADGQQVGTNYEAAVRAKRLTGLERVIVQRNKIHHPRYGANSWTFGHPLGPQGIGFEESAGGNHVFRYNEIYSSEGHYFNDGIGEGWNFSSVGFPHADSDIYGNLITHCWDDGIESEGGNRNVRIWGNYLDRTGSIASSATHTGPLYVFRNVFNRSRSHKTGTSSDVRAAFVKAGDAGGFGGGRQYWLHNTLLQAAGSSTLLGANGGIDDTSRPVNNAVTRNNIFHLWTSSATAIRASGSGNSFDNDLYNGSIAAYAGAQLNGIVGTPIYTAGHGWQNEAGGYYQLAPNSPGYDRGARLPNFNDDFTGAAPDIGAAEAGKPPMRFGVNAGQ